MDIAPRRTLAAALLAGGVLVLSGCGGDSTPTDPEGGGEAAPACEWKYEEHADDQTLGIVPNVKPEYLDDIHPGNLAGTFKTDMIDPGQFVIGSNAARRTGSSEFGPDYVQTISIYKASECDDPLATVTVTEADYVELEGSEFNAWFVDSGLTDLGPDDDLAFEVRGADGKLKVSFCWEPKRSFCGGTMAGVVRDHLETQ